MSVRQSLLAILDQGPCYGYQLKHEYDRRTGATSSLNVGQIYNTLERLERDALVRRGDADEHGHVYWQITDEGSVEVSRWLASPVVRSPTTRDELAVKLAVAATLPGIDAVAVIRTQRAESLAHLQSLRRTSYGEQGSSDPQELAWSMVMDARIFAAEAETRWLDHIETRLTQYQGATASLALATERPKRGRPARAGVA